MKNSVRLSAHHKNERDNLIINYFSTRRIALKWLNIVGKCMLSIEIETLQYDAKRIDTLRRWKKPNHSPHVIKGIRQCGKTYILQEFAKEYYKHETGINFISRRR